MATQVRPPKGSPPAQTALTDNTAQIAVAAPGAGKHLIVRGFALSSSGASQTTVDVKDNNTIRFTFSLPANGASVVWNLPQEWHLATNSALKVQQSANVNSFFTPWWEIVAD